MAPCVQWPPHILATLLRRPTSQCVQGPHIIAALLHHPTSPRAQWATHTRRRKATRQTHPHTSAGARRRTVAPPSPPPSPGETQRRVSISLQIPAFFRQHRQKIPSHHRRSTAAHSSAAPSTVAPPSPPPYPGETQRRVSISLHIPAIFRQIRRKIPSRHRRSTAAHGGAAPSRQNPRRRVSQAHTSPPRSRNDSMKWASRARHGPVPSPPKEPPPPKDTNEHLAI